MQKPDPLIRRFALTGLALALTVIEGWAVSPYQPVHPDPVLDSWRWQSFPELKGLGLRCLAEVKDGTMWFGTDEGVRSYDGLRWKVHTSEDGLLGKAVDMLLETRDGSLYAATDMGISRFKNRTWSRVFPLAGDLPWFINSLMEASDGNVWAGTAWGALRLDREGAVLYTTEETGAALRVLAPQVPLSIIPNSAAPARRWAEGVGIQVAEGRYLGMPRAHMPMVIWSLAPGGPGERMGLKVGDRIIAVDGQPWINMEPWVAPNRLIGPVDVSVKLTVQREGLPEPLEVVLNRERIEGTFRNFSVHDIYEDREKRMWLGLDEGEVLRISSLQPDAVATWRLYTAEDGLDTGYGPRIAQTRDGTIWTVCYRGLIGANRLDGNVPIDHVD